MAEVYKRDNSPYWYYDIWVNGERKRGSTKRKTKKEAQAVADELEKQELDRAQFGHLEEITLEEAVSLHVQRVQHLSDKRRIEWRLNRVIGKIEGHEGLDPSMPFHELRTKHIEQIKNWRLKEESAKRTINAEIAAVRRMINDLATLEQYRLPEPRPKFVLFKVKQKARPLSEDELDSLLGHLDPRSSNQPLGDVTIKERQDNYDFTVLLADTGMRYDELAKLTWGQVAHDNSYIDVHRWKVDNDGRLMLTKRAQLVLARRRSERNPQVAYVFTDKTGKGPRKYAPGAIRRAMDKVGINSEEKVAMYGTRSIHSLRDTFATRVRRKGMSIDGIQKLLGHASPTMSMKYADIDTFTVSQRAVALLDD